MKNFKMLYIALIAFVASVFGACTNGFEPGPQVSGPQVSFAPTNPKTIVFTGSEGEGTQKLTLTRAESEQELSVFVIAEVEKGAESLFTIPELVNFAAGETTAELVMQIQSTQLENDKEYTVKLYLDETMSTPYGYAEWQVVFSVNPWELMTDSKGNNAKGKFRGLDLLTGLYSLDPTIEVDVDIYKHKSKNGVYRVSNPWIASFIASSGTSSKEEAEEAEGIKMTPADFEIDCSDPNCVWFAMQSTGCDFGYGLTYTMSMYWYDQTYASGSQGAVGGTLVDGIITIPVKGALALEPGYDDGAYYGNKNGMFRIVLPGVDVADYSLAVAYDGMDVAADNKTTTAKFKFTYGDDVTGINYMIVNGNVEADPSAALNTLFGGQDENILEVENFVKGGKEVGVRVGMERGVYTIVAAPADKNGQLRQKDYLVTSFYFAGIGDAEEHPCVINVETKKMSETGDIFGEDVVAANPDYATVAVNIVGEEIRYCKYLFADAATINGVMSQAGLTFQEVVLQFGAELPAQVLSLVNSEGGLATYFDGLDADTQYMVGVYAENNYGENAFASATHTTDAIPYSGSLVVGNYKMSCTMGAGTESETTFENIFNVSPVPGSNTDFLLSKFAIEDNLKWQAAYDEANNTLTLSGIANGLENYGPLFGNAYGDYNAEGTLKYGIFSYATEDENARGNDPIVLNVDPSTKQLCSLPAGSSIWVYVFQVAGEQLQNLGSYNAFDDTTVIAPYVEDGGAATASVKSTKSTIQIPFSSINKLKVSKFGLQNNRMTTPVSNSLNRGVKSVKPLVVEGYTPVKANGFKSTKTNAIPFRR